MMDVSESSRCVVTGGYWGIMYPDDPNEQCNTQTFDGEKEYTDSSQCSGFCQAKPGSEWLTEDAGMCSKYELRTGCTTEIENGIVQETLCF